MQQTILKPQFRKFDEAPSIGVNDLQRDIHNSHRPNLHGLTLHFLKQRLHCCHSISTHCRGSRRSHVQREKSQTGLTCNPTENRLMRKFCFIQTSDMPCMHVFKPITPSINLLYVIVIGFSSQHWAKN